MKKINYKPILKFILYIIIITSIQSILNLIITIPNTINTFISLILINLYILINNINIGKTITDKAYKTGFINGLTTILTLTILNIITFNISASSAYLSHSLFL